MSLTRLQMANEVLDNLSRGGTALTRSSTLLSDRAVTWLNRGQVYFYRNYDLIFKRSTTVTVAGQENYAFPADMKAVYSFVIQNGTLSWKLKCVMPWEFDRYTANPSALSSYQPRLYVPFKTTKDFELFPVPDQVYTVNLRYSTYPSDLNSDGQTTDYAALNIDIDDVLIKYATAEGFKYLQELVDSEKWFSDAVKSAKEVYQEVKDSYPDWSPSGDGFVAKPQYDYTYLGDYWNNPFVGSTPSGI